MNYRFYFDRQLKLYVLMVLIWAASYGTTLYLISGKPITLTTSHVAAFLSGSLSFIFIGAYIMAKEDPFNKG